MSRIGTENDFEKNVCYWHVQNENACYIEYSDGMLQDYIIKWGLGSLENNLVIY